MNVEINAKQALPVSMAIVLHPVRKARYFVIKIASILKRITLIAEQHWAEPVMRKINLTAIIKVKPVAQAEPAQKVHVIAQAL